MKPQEYLRDRIYTYIDKNQDKNKNEVAAHFIAKGTPKSTVYRIFNRYQAGVTVEHQATPRIFDQSAIKKLTRMMDHKCGISQRSAARKFGCSHVAISKVLRMKTPIRCYKKQVIPFRDAKQRVKARKRCSALYRKYRDRVWILDDESYFTLKHSTINGNDNFYSSNLDRTPANVKYTAKEKYEPKLLIWLAISPSGISRILVTQSGHAINAEIYTKECLKARLLPFIKKHHAKDNYVFWPDLASAHYAETALDFLIENMINHVDKLDNPPALPEIRPIERFWALLKAAVYKNGWEAKNLVELEKRIRLCIKNFDKAAIQKLLEGVKRKIDDVRRYDVIENRK